MRYSGAEGSALIAALLALLLMSALGAALVAVSSSEVMIAANFRNGLEALHAADAVAERAMSDLAVLEDWNPVLDGTVRSTFADGPPAGTRLLPDGATLDLSRVQNLANCRKAAACSDADMDAVTRDRPWGANNPRWQLYAYGPLSEVLPGAFVDSPFYVIALVGDDPAENDNDPTRDGIGEDNDGTGIVVLRAEAFGPRGVHKVVEVTVGRTDRGGIREVSWCEVR